MRWSIEELINMYRYRIYLIQKPSYIFISIWIMITESIRWVFKGYCLYTINNLDRYLMQVISSRLKIFNEYGYDRPAQVKGEKNDEYYDDELPFNNDTEIIISVFDDILTQGVPNENNYKKISNFNKAMKKLRKIFFRLWNPNQ